MAKLMVQIRRKIACLNASSKTMQQARWEGNWEHELEAGIHGKLKNEMVMVRTRFKCYSTILTPEADNNGDWFHRKIDMTGFEIMEPQTRSSHSSIEIWVDGNRNRHEIILAQV
jgi:hypothetical protein